MLTQSVEFFRTTYEFSSFAISHFIGTSYSKNLLIPAQECWYVVLHNVVTSA